MKCRMAVLAVIVAAMSVGVAAPVVAAPVGATESSCGISWGSLRKTAASTASSQLTNVRGGQHACYDRLVLDFAGKTDGYWVYYVDHVGEIGSGHVVPLRGGAKLLITAVGPAHDDDYNPTYDPADYDELVDVGGWQTFRQVVDAGSFEGVTDIGIGVRARLPFRVSYLDGPGAGSRLVIDVAHRWS